MKLVELTAAVLFIFYPARCQKSGDQLTTLKAPPLGAIIPVFCGTTTPAAALNNQTTIFVCRCPLDSKFVKFVTVK